MKHLLIFILFLFLFQITSGQKPDYKFLHLTIDEGLSNSTVYSVLQDKNGFIWLGTQDGGLNRYDGYKFKIYTNDVKDKNSISNNSVNALAEDQNGNIWIGTWGGGLNKYDPVLDQFTRFQFSKNTTNCISSNIIQSIFVSKSNLVWVGTADAGLNCLNTKTNQIKVFRHDSKNQNSLINNRVWSICEDKKGNLWIATNGGLDYFDIKKEEFQHFKFIPKNLNGLSHFQVRSVMLDNTGKLWIGTAKGVDIYNITNNTFEHLKVYPQDTANSQRNNVNTIFQDKFNTIWIGTQQGGITRYNPSNGEMTNFLSDENNPISISYDDCRSVFQDRSGTLWIGTRGGGVNLLDLYQKKILHFKRDPFKKMTLSDNKVQAIVQDANQDLLWIGTDHGGLNLFNRKTKEFTVFKKGIKNSVTSNRILALAQDKKGIVWIGTNDEGINWYDPKTRKFGEFRNDKNNPRSLNDVDVRCIFQDSKENIWVGTKEGLNLYVDETKDFIQFKSNSHSKKSLSNNRINCMYETKDHKLWIGTDKGLNIFNVENHTFKTLANSPESKINLTEDIIYSVYQDKSGSVWVGTGNGLAKVNFTKDGTMKCMNFGRASGFRGVAIYGITEDNHQNLWITTNNGLAKFSLRSLTATIFDKTDGLQGNEFNSRAISKNLSGEIIVGGNNGFNIFHPDSIKDNPFVPQIMLTDFQIFNISVASGTTSLLKKSLNYTDIIELSYKDYMFAFEFATSHFIDSHENTFAYKMEGIDKGWNYIGSKHYTTYTSIPPGEYTFKVKGTNSDGVWNENGISIKVIITPPFYQTYLFYILCAFIVLNITFVLVKVRERELVKTKRRLEEKVEARTSQINDQKNEIELQRDVVTKQNQGITDSIQYASKIQTAMLPPDKMLADLLTENFIFYRPRDIVSGDFYWLKFKHHKIYFAVADCTGHGVPGAFMSMLGITLLNEIIEYIDNKSNTAEILQNLKERVISSLHQTGKMSDSKDGMDISLCIYDIEKDTIHFSGANNSIYIVRKNENLPFLIPENEPKYIIYNQDNYSLLEIKADKIPISFYLKQERTYTNHVLHLLPGDTIYLHTDGYTDQFGGPNDRKYLSKRFIKLLLNIQNNSMIDQKYLIEQAHNDWKGGGKQIDDILVLGIRIG